MNMKEVLKNASEAAKDVRRIRGQKKVIHEGALELEAKCEALRDGLRAILEELGEYHFSTETFWWKRRNWYQ